MDGEKRFYRNDRLRFSIAGTRVSRMVIFVAVCDDVGAVSAVWFAQRTLIYNYYQNPTVVCDCTCLRRPVHIMMCNLLST
jgi:hypothetical protein